MIESVVSPDTVGRSSEFEALDAALRQAQAGRPHTVIVRGEAGVGKTRLCLDVARRAGERGVQLLRGECLKLEAGEFPYAPVVGALRSIDRAALEAAVPPAGRTEIARLVPELAHDAPAADGEMRFSSHAQGRLFEMVLALLRHLGEAAPVMFLIEDAHWADRSTRDFIVFLARNLTRERVALVVTYREEGIPAGAGTDAPAPRARIVSRDPLRSVVNELIRRDGVSRITLRPLARDDVELQLDAILGRDAERRLVDRIYSRSGGNPFNVEELLAAHLAGEGDEIPDTIREALLLRFEAVPEEVRRILRALAVVGRPASQELVRVVAALDEPVMGRALREAVDAQIVFFRREDRRLAFRHALMREAVADELLPSEAVALHVAIADALAAAGAANAAELAFHLEAAERWPDAFIARVDAGLQAELVFAFTEAREHFEHALALAKRPDVNPTASRLDSVDLLRHAAEANRRAGRDKAATERMYEAVAAIDAGADPGRAAVLHARLGDCFLWDDDAALASYETALRLLPQDSTGTRVQTLGATARALHNMRRWSDALAPARAALELAASDPAARAHSYDAHLALGIALAFLGDPEPGERHVREGQRLAEAHGAPEDRSRAFTFVGEVLRLAGKFEEAHSVMRAAEREVAALGLSESFGRAISVNAVEDLVRLGRWEEADRRLHELARLDLREDAELLHRLLSGQLATARGDLGSGRRHLDAARELARRGDVAADYWASVHCAAAELALWSAAPADAVREVENGLRAVGPLQDPLYVPALYGLGTRALADVAVHARGRRSAVGTDEADAADRFVAQLESVRARHSRVTSPPELLAWLALCRAEAARARSTASPELWEDAERRWSGLEQPYPAGYAAWRLAEALRDRGRRAEAASASQRAAERADALGARPLLAEIEALRRRSNLPAGQRPEGDAFKESSPARRKGLTPREVDVLGLLAEGCTNPQIAERLFITDHTVKRHVDHILRKLDATNRQAAVSVAHLEGLLDSLPASR